MTDLIKIFLLNSRYLFDFVENKILTKEDVLNFINLNSKIRNDILAYYERVFKLEFSNLVNVKNKYYLSLYFTFKLSKISKNVIDCIDLGMEFDIFREIVFVSPNIEFTNESFKLQPAIVYDPNSNEIYTEKIIIGKDQSDIFRKEIIKMHNEIYKSLISFNNTSFNEEYKAIYEKFGFYPFDNRKFLKLQKHDFLKSIKKYRKSVVSANFHWNCFSENGLRIVSEYLFERDTFCKSIRSSLGRIIHYSKPKYEIETILNSMRCEIIVSS